MALSRTLLLVLPSLVRCALSQTSVANEDAAQKGWQADDNTRSSWSILWSNLAAVFACTWTILHLNTPGIKEYVWPLSTSQVFYHCEGRQAIPSRLSLSKLPELIRETNRSDAVVLRRKIKWFLVAVLAPELVATAALVQFLEARRTVVAFAKLRAAEERRASAAAKDATDAPTPSLPSSVPYPWTLAHGFLSATGALIVQAEGGDGEYSVLNEQDVIGLATSGRAIFPEIRAKDIGDRSKADGFAKLFALGQSIWLLINILSRAAYGLPISPIEFITIGYVACSVIIYGLWWCKPKDVVVPFVVRLSLPTPVAPAAAAAAATAGAGAGQQQQQQQQQQQHSGAQTDDSAGGLSGYVGRISHRRENIDDDPRHTNLVGGAAGVLAVIYCGIHIAAWDFAFASAGERIAWRVCSVGSTAAPIVGLLCPLLLLAEDEDAPRLSWRGACMILYFILYVGLAVAYVVARMVLIVLACIAMRSLPSACYVTVDWINALPHF